MYILLTLYRKTDKRHTDAHTSIKNSISKAYILHRYKNYLLASDYRSGVIYAGVTYALKYMKKREKNTVADVENGISFKTFISNELSIYVPLDVACWIVVQFF